MTSSIEGKLMLFNTNVVLKNHKEGQIGLENKFSYTNLTLNLENLEDRLKT